MLGVPSNTQSWRTLRSPSDISFGQTAGGPDNYNPSTMGNSVASVGLVEGPVTINQNPETSPRMSDQLYSPYDIDMTAQAWQVTFSLDQVDVYNFALQISSAQASVTGQSIVALRGREYFAGLKCMQIQTDAARATATSSLTTQKFMFYKVKVFQNGPVEIGRETQTRLPLIAHCLANDSDIVGEFAIDNEAQGSAPGYES